MSTDTLSPSATAAASAAPVRRRTRRWRVPAFLIGLVLPAVVIAFWAMAYRLGWVNPLLFSSPWQVAQTMWEAALDGTLWEHIYASGKRWVIGITIGGILGLLSGALTGLSKPAENLLDTTIQMMRTVPFMGLVPLFVIWFGLGESPKIILIAFATYCQLYLATFNGIRNIDRKLLEVGRVYQLGRTAMLVRIILPAAMPQILNGVRLGFGVGWLALVVAELNGANSGVGFWMQQGREYVRVDIVLSALLIFAVVGKLVDVMVKGLERRMLSWRDNIEKEM